MAKLLALVFTLSLVVTGACKSKDDGGNHKPEVKLNRGAGKQNRRRRQPLPTSGPAFDQCTRILEKTWVAARASLEKLKVPDTDKLKTVYTNLGRGFVRKCATLPDDKRDCLEKASNAASALYSCNVNEGRRRYRIWAVDMTRHIKALAPMPLDPKRAKALPASLAGTWVSEWKGRGQKTVWTLDKTGKGTMTISVRGKARPPIALAVAAKQQRRLEVTKARRTRSHVFFRADANTFYLSNNLLYDVYPIGDKKKFTIRAGWDFLSYDNGACEVFNVRGEVAKATCSFAEQNHHKVFNIEYTYPGHTGGKKQRVSSRRRMLVINKHLVHESLSTIGKFVKTK